MIVLDCSVVIDLLVRPSTLTAPDARWEWHSPALLDIEIVFALRGLLLGGHIDDHAADIALTDYADLAIRTWPTSAAHRHRILELRHNLSAYDAAYVALAEALDAPLLTRDHRVASTAPAQLRVDVV